MTHQQEFDAAYVTSSEICRRVGVTRASIVIAHNKGWLPEPVRLDKTINIWKRSEAEPLIVAWIEKRKAAGKIA